MHELSIAGSVVRVACAHAGERRVTKVWVQVGHLRQVVPSSLRFAFGLVAEGTVAEGAELEIQDVPAAGRCRACAGETALPQLPLCCERCGSFDVAVLRGEELLVDSLELEEETPMTIGGMGRGD